MEKVWVRKDDGKRIIWMRRISGGEAGGGEWSEERMKRTEMIDKKWRDPIQLRKREEEMRELGCKRSKIERARDAEKKTLAVKISSDESTASGHHHLLQVTMD